jgi:DNA-binding GntR family transcriptional regulator
MERKKGAGMKEVSTQIEKRRLTDLVIDQLVAMITKGGLQAGDKLPPEPELMKRFGVGRGSLREAVGALPLIGLLTVRPGSGTQVSMSASDKAAKRSGKKSIQADLQHEGTPRFRRRKVDGHPPEATVPEDKRQIDCTPTGLGVLTPDDDRRRCQGDDAKLRPEDFP